MSQSTKRRRTRQLNKPATMTARNGQAPATEPAPPEIYTTIGNASASAPGRYAGKTLAEVLRAAQGEAILAERDVAVWEGDRLAAMIQYDGDAPALTTVVKPDDAKPPKPQPYRRSNQQPMLYQCITFAPPWEPSCPLTLEIILLPSGTGSSVDTVDNEKEIDAAGVPLTREDLRVLKQEGWHEHEDTAVCAFVRFIR